LLGVAGVVEATEAFIRRTVQGQQGNNWLRTVSAAGMAIYKWSQVNCDGRGRIGIARRWSWISDRILRLIKNHRVWTCSPS
jgi:hypothetical protein